MALSSWNITPGQLLIRVVTVMVVTFLGIVIVYDRSELQFSWEWPSRGKKHTQKSSAELAIFLSEGLLHGKKDTKNSTDELPKSSPERLLRLKKQDTNDKTAELPLPSGWSLRGKKLTPLLFVHIHKAGGTTICQIAQAVRISTPKPAKTRKDVTSWFSKNCNPNFADGWRGRAYGFSGPEAMLDYAKTVDMYAIEWPLPSQLPSELNILLVLREPLHLFFSLCVTELSELAKSPHLTSVVGKARQCMDKNKEYQTKYLAGCKSAGLKACRFSDIETHDVTPADVMVAKNIIEERAVAVLITERLDESQPILLAALGWNLKTSASQHRSGTHQTWVENLPGWGPSVREQTAALRSALQSWSPQLLSDFVIANVGDQQLYNTASQRFTQMLSHSEIMIGANNAYST